MEAITIAGLAVVVVGGYFTVLDFLGDLGLTSRMAKHGKKESIAVGRDVCSHQTRIKKVAGMYI